MTNEAIEHVKEAESTVHQIRQDANEKINAIKSERDSKIQQINQEADGELRVFKKEQRQKFEDSLQDIINQNKENVKEESQKYQAIYESKEEELSSYIVREVLKRYGN